MAEIKWIKLTVDMFDNRKIKYLRKLPDGNSIVLIWIQLLTMAGRCNAGGMIFLTENIPYTTKMLADELDFEENTIIFALNALHQLGMITRDGDVIGIAGWDKHQNIDGMEKIREQNRIRKQNQRERERQALVDSHIDEAGMSRDTSRNVTQQNKNKKENKNKESDIDYSSIASLFNSICSSLPQIRSMTDARRKKIKARLQTFSMEDIEKAFRKAQKSDFLTGKVNDWQASFDWIMSSDEHITRILEGNYDSRKASTKKNGFANFHQRDYDYDELERTLLQSNYGISEEGKGVGNE